jgi:signal transduction histidine kinase
MEDVMLTREYLDTGILLILGLILSFYLPGFEDQAVAFLLAFILTAVQLYFDTTKAFWGIVGIYVILTLPIPLLGLYVPAMAYTLFRSNHGIWTLGAVIPIINGWNYVGSVLTFLVVGLTGMAILIQKRTSNIYSLERDFFHLQDESKVLLDRLEERQHQLLEQQESTIQTATLNERNRIARDIHDNVGHLLSSALLQTAAIRTSVPQDLPSQSLNHLQETLDQAMTSIRSSVHQLHETSVSFEDHLHSIVASFPGCPITLDLDLYNQPLKVQKFALLSVVKEALSNITNHAHASFCTLRLKEHPGFYQLFIENDGIQLGPREQSDPQSLFTKGIGLRNMQDRVDQLGGRFQLTLSDRFSIHITIPKEK